jgi:hypothetical protein
MSEEVVDDVAEEIRVSRDRKPDVECYNYKKYKHYA